MKSSEKEKAPLMRGIKAFLIVLVIVSYLWKEKEINTFATEKAAVVKSWSDKRVAKKEAKRKRLLAAYNPILKPNTFKEVEIPPNGERVRIDTHRRDFSLQPMISGIIARVKLTNGQWWEEIGVTDENYEFALIKGTYKYKNPPRWDEIAYVEVRQGTSLAKQGKVVTLPTLLYKL